MSRPPSISTLASSIPRIFGSTTPTSGTALRRATTPTPRALLRGSRTPTSGTLLRGSTTPTSAPPTPRRFSGSMIPSTTPASYFSFSPTSSSTEDYKLERSEGVIRMQKELMDIHKSSTKRLEKQLKDRSLELERKIQETMEKQFEDRALELERRIQETMEKQLEHRALELERKVQETLEKQLEQMAIELERQIQETLDKQQEAKSPQLGSDAETLESLTRNSQLSVRSEIVSHDHRYASLQAKLDRLKPSQAVYDTYVKENPVKVGTWISIRPGQPPVEHSTYEQAATENQDIQDWFCDEYRGPNPAPYHIFVHGAYQKDNQPHELAHIKAKVSKPNVEAPNPEVALIIDTGATLCFGPLEILNDQLGLDPIALSKVGTGFGGNIKFIPVRANIEVGDLPLTSVVIGFPDPIGNPDVWIPWILGQNFLKKCRHTWTNGTSVELEFLNQ